MNPNVNGALQLRLWGGIDDAKKYPAASGSGAPQGRSAGGGYGGAALDAAVMAADPAGPRPSGPGEAGLPRRSHGTGEAKAGRGSTPRPSSPDLQQVPRITS